MLALSYILLQGTFLLSHSFWIKIAELASLTLCKCTHKPVLYSKITNHAKFIFGVYRGHIYFVSYSVNAKTCITQTSPIHKQVQEAELCYCHIQKKSVYNNTINIMAI
jgi:hypothetical protein